MENVEYESDEDVGSRVQELVDGIKLSDLRSKEGVILRLDKGYELQDDDQASDDYFLSVQEAMDDSEKIRQLRKGPPSGTSFQGLASTMEKVDPNGLVTKEIITAGAGPVVPDKAKVWLHYNMYKEFDDDPFDSTFLRGKPQSVFLNVGGLIEGMEAAVKTMKKKENSRFILHPSVAFGKLGCPPRIPGNCYVYVDLTLMDFSVLETNAVVDENGATEDEVMSVPFEDSMKKAKSFHSLGNSEFKQARFRQAIQYYRKELNVLDKMHLANDEEEKKMLDQKLICHTNLATSYNKLVKPQQACNHCKDALAVNPRHTKAMFQYGRALLLLSEFRQCKTWLLRAKRVEPNNPDIDKELAALEKKMERSKVDEKAFWEKGFKPSN